MKLTKPQFAVVVLAWVTILLLCVAVCEAATLPPELKAVQPNLCSVRAGSSLGSGVYMGAGICLSCSHLVDRVKRVKVSFFGGGEYEGVVVGRSKRFDNAYIRIKRPIEKAIRGIRLAPKDPKNGDTIWRAGYGHSPRKLFWFKGVMNHSYGGWIQTSGRSIGGDSGGAMFSIEDDGEVVLIGNLWGTDGKNTLGSKPSTIASTLGAYALDALNTEWYLTANCGPLGCSPRRTQILGGGGLRQRVTPKAPEQRDPGGIAAETPPLDVDTGLISAQVAAFQADADSAIEQAKAATQAAIDQANTTVEQANAATQDALIQADKATAEMAAMIEKSRIEKQDRQHETRMAELDAKMEAATTPAVVDPTPASDPRGETAPPQLSVTETAEKYLPWIALAVVVIYFLWRDRKQDGNTSIADVREAVAAGQQAKAAVEAMIQPLPPPMPTPPPLTHTFGDQVVPSPSLTVVARSVAADVKERKAVLAEAQVAAGTTISRAQEDNQRDASTLAEAAKEVMV